MLLAEYGGETSGLSSCKGTKVFWLIPLFWLTTSAVMFEEPQQETTPAPIVSYITTEQTLELPTDNGMAIEVIPEIKVDSPTALETEPTTVEEPETVVVPFPENHKNLTSNLYVEGYPPYYHQLNEYQQQYKNYYEQKQLYSGKPIKFEEDSLKNFYVPQTIQVTETQEEEKKPEAVRVNRKPFPYVFENEKTPEDWYSKDIRHVIMKEQPEQNYVVKGHQEHVLPHYVTPYKHYNDQQYYNNEVKYYNHHNHYDLGKEKIDPWKKVFKVLTALVPLGLLLATLTPNVISINSTGTNLNTRQRSVEPNEFKFKEEDILRLLKEYGVDSLNETQCEDRVICELARKGENSSANSIEKGFWYLANETPWEVAEEAGMTELFKAIKTGTCELFKCGSKTITSKRSRFGKKLVRKRKIQHEKKQ